MVMNLESIQNKQLQQIEQLAKDLHALLVKAKLSDEPVCKELAALVKDAAEERQSRFDGADNRFKGF
jgi:hypothetical protein